MNIISMFAKLDEHIDELRDVVLGDFDSQMTDVREDIEKIRNAIFYMQGQIDVYEAALLPKTRAAQKQESIEEIVSRNIAQSKGKR